MKQPQGTDQPGRSVSRLAINVLLVILFTAGSLWLADLAFRAYERAWLLPRLPDATGAGPVNLAALRYNEGLVERASAPDEFRILSFGDSYAYSVMEPPLSYGGVLQQQLDETVQNWEFRVINLGEPATGARHFREAYDYWAQVFEHQAVLFHLFLGNDILDDAYLYASVDWAPNEAVIRGGNAILDAGSRRVPRKYPLRMFDYAWAWFMSAQTRSKQGLPEGYNWAGLTDFDEKTFTAINFKYMENFDPRKLENLLPGYEQVKLLLERAQAVAESGMPVAVALGPAETQVDDALRARVLDANNADAAGYDMDLPQRIIGRMHERFAPDVTLIDLTPAFRHARNQSGVKLYFRRNTHWDQAGNQLAGEVLAQALVSAWFEGQSSASMANEPPPAPDPADLAAIDAYLAPLAGDTDPDRPVISGAVRAIQMQDGITEQADNWAIAPLDEPVLIRFGYPQNLHSMRLYLFHEDGRLYRFTVDAFQDDQWRRVADHSQQAVGGVQEILLGDEPVLQLRITGLYNSSQEGNAANAFLHIQEVEFVKKPANP